MQGSFFSLLRSRANSKHQLSQLNTSIIPLRLLEYALILGDAHCPQLLRPVVFVQHVVRVLPQLFHVCTDEHLPKLDEIAVCFVVHLYGAPWIGSTTYLPAVWKADERIGADNRKRDFALCIPHISNWGTRKRLPTDDDLLVLLHSFLILVLILGRLEYVDAMVFNVGENLQLI